MAVLGTGQFNAVVLLLLDTQHYGLLIAQIFFGLWLVPLGYLAFKSRMFPTALSVVLIVGGICYLVDLLAAFLLPASANNFTAPSLSRAQSRKSGWSSTCWSGA